MFYNRTRREYGLPVVRRPLAQHQFGYNRPVESFTPWGSWQCVGYTAPEADILELDDQYLLEIALPGVVLDDIELKVEDNIITVIAKRTPAMFEERAAVLSKELPAGYLIRHFEFETEILHDQIEARMDRGILFVHVPKVEAALRIPVSGGSIESHFPGMKTRVTTKSEMRSGKEVTIK